MKYLMQTQEQICLLKFKSQNWDIRMYASCWRWHIYNVVLSFNMEHFYWNYHLEMEFVTDCSIASCMHAQLLQLCLILCDPMDCSLPGSSVHRDSPGRNTGVGCHHLLQGIFQTQGLNPGLPHCRWILYCLSHQGSPSRILLTLRYLITSLKAGIKRLFHTKTNPSYSNCNLKKFV